MNGQTTSRYSSLRLAKQKGSHKKSTKSLGGVRGQLLTGGILLIITVGAFLLANIELPEKMSETSVQLTISRNLSDLTLAPNSLWTVYATNAFTLAHRIPAFLTRHYGIDPYRLERVRFFCSILAAVFGIFYLTLAISKDQTTSLVTVVLILSSQLSLLGWYFPVNFLDRPYDAYTSLATVIVALAFLYSGMPKISFFIAGFLFNFHIVHSALIFFLLLMCIIVTSRTKVRTVAACSGVYLIGCTPLLFYGSVINPALLSFTATNIPSDQWWKLIKVMKYSSIFPSSMGLPRFARDCSFVLAFLALVYWCIRHEKEERGVDKERLRLHQYSLTVFGGVVFLAAIGTIFTEVLPISRFLASAQPYRSSTYLIVLSGSYVCMYLVRLFRDEQWFARFSAFFCFLLLVMGGEEYGAIILLSCIVSYMRLFDSRMSLLASTWLALRRNTWREFSFRAKFLAGLVALIVLSAALALLYLALFRALFNALGVSRGVKLMALIWASAWLVRQCYPTIDLKSWVPRLSSAGLFLVTATLSLYFYSSYQLIGSASPKEHEMLVAWKDVQLWARTSSPRTAIFVNPFEMSGFEVWSERTSVLSVNELGSLSLYVPDTFYPELSRARDYGVDVLTLPNHIRGRWEVARMMREKYATFTESDFRRFAAKYGASYAIVGSEKSLKFPKTYANNYFAVYRITAD